MRPGCLAAMPPVDAPAVTFPCASTATAPTVPCLWPSVWTGSPSTWLPLCARFPAPLPTLPFASATVAVASATAPISIDERHARLDGELLGPSAHQQHVRACQHRTRQRDGVLDPLDTRHRTRIQRRAVHDPGI